MRCGGQGHSIVSFLPIVLTCCTEREEQSRSRQPPVINYGATETPAFRPGDYDVRDSRQSWGKPLSSKGQNALHGRMGERGGKWRIILTSGLNDAKDSLRPEVYGVHEGRALNTEIAM